MKSMLLDHLPTKTAALVVAILAYTYLYSRATKTLTQDFPLLTVAAPQHHVLINVGKDAIAQLDRPDTRIKVQIEGVESDVEKFIDRRELVADVNLIRFTPARGQAPTRIKLNPEDILFRAKPAAVTIRYPDGLPEVTISRRTTWVVNLEVPRDQLNTIQNYDVTNVSLQPTEIRVSGPSELEPKLTTLELQGSKLQTPSNQPLECRFSPEELSMMINRLGSFPHLQILGDPQVVVRVDIAPQPVEEEFLLQSALVVTSTVEDENGNPVSIFQANLAIKLTVKQKVLTQNKLELVRVTLRGPQEELNKIKDDPTRYRVRFDLTEFLNRSERISTIRGIVENLPPTVTYDPIEGTLNLEQ